MHYWISSDLDGTLLDHFDYSFDAAMDGLELCRANNIPVVLNTSKTSSETQVVQDSLGLDGPIIVENGSALLFRSSQGSRIDTSLVRTLNNGLSQIMFGCPREDIIDFIDSARSVHKWKLEGFNDWTIEQISDKTGLSQDEAKLASAKQFSEPFLWQDTQNAFQQFEELAIKNGFQLLKGGRFFHLQGNCNKAKPLRWLRGHLHSVEGMYHLDKQMAELICLGDSDNDVAMLEEADIPVCIPNGSGSRPVIKDTVGAIFPKQKGPAGWSEALIEIIQQSS